MQNVLENHFYTTNALLSDEFEEESPTRNCLDTINPPLQVNQIPDNRVTRTKAMFYKNGEPICGHPCFILKKISTNDCILALGSSKKPSLEHQHRYLRVPVETEQVMTENDLFTEPAHFYDRTFYINLSCVILVNGRFVTPNTNNALKRFARDDRLTPSGTVGITQNLYDSSVRLTDESLKKFTEAYHQYHANRPKHETAHINPRIYEFGATMDTEEEDPSINSQDEEMAQQYSLEFGRVEIGMDGIEISLPDEVIEE